MKKTPRIPIPPAVREYVYQRDNHRCQSCGKTAQDSKLSIDHIVPLAKGGANDMSNLQTLCLSCNRQKRHHFDSRFQRRFKG